VAPQDCQDSDVTWLTARGLALLVCLRRRTLTVGELGRRIDEPARDVMELVEEYAAMGLVTATTGATLALTDVTLTDEGRDYLVRSRSAL
jgi:DNA-binding IclR family transcriptional regulator